MKIALVTFTYSGDSALANAQGKAIARVKAAYPEHTLARCVCDDARSPIPEGERPPADVYMQTSYNRGGNLRGLENLEGQLGVYQALCADGYDLLIKLDSDTILNRLDWIPPAKTLEVYSQIGCAENGQFCEGVCNAITPAGVACAVEALAREGVKARLLAGEVKEDVSITPLLRMAGAHALILPGDVNNALAGGIAPAWWLDALPDNLAPLFARSAISFKAHTSGMTDAGKAEACADALARMAAYVEALRNAEDDALKDTSREKYKAHMITLEARRKQREEERAQQEVELEKYLAKKGARRTQITKEKEAQKVKENENEEA